MVTQKTWEGEQAILEVGREYVLSGFSGQYDFSFLSRAIQILAIPFPYATLAYPGSVSARLVRKLARVRTSLPGVASNLGGDMVRNVILADLTVAGALIDAPAPLGLAGDLLHLAFTADLDHYKVDLALLAHIRHVHKSGFGRYTIGVEFKDLTRDDELVLHYLVHSWADQGE